MSQLQSKWKCWPLWFRRADYYFKTFFVRCISSSTQCCCHKENLHVSTFKWLIQPYLTAFEKSTTPEKSGSSASRCEACPPSSPSRLAKARVGSCTSRAAAAARSPPGPPTDRRLSLTILEKYQSSSRTQSELSNYYKWLLINLRNKAKRSYVSISVRTKFWCVRTKSMALSRDPGSMP